MQHNEVYINKYGIIEIHVVGDQTVKTVNAMGDGVRKLAQELRDAAKPVLVLDVLDQMGQVPPEARRQVVAIAKEVVFVRAAMVGKSPVLRLGANLILRAIGKGGMVKYFEDYAVAVEWLLVAVEP
jgi:hypothetical protein